MRSHASSIGPLLLAMSKLKTERVSVSTDPRCYPVNSEMMWLDECLKPTVILGQEEATRRVKIWGQRCNLKVTHGQVETWQLHRQRENVCTTPWKDRKDGVLILSHAHLKDGRWADYRNWTWLRVFEWLEDLGLEWAVVGDEWHLHTHYEELKSKFLGPIEPHSAWMLYDDWKYSLCIAPAEGYTTPKPYHIVRNGCVPLVWNEGPLAFPETDHFPPDSEHRVDSLTTRLPNACPNFKPYFNQLEGALRGEFSAQNAITPYIGDTE